MILKTWFVAWKMMSCKIIEDWCFLLDVVVWLTLWCPIIDKYLFIWETRLVLCVLSTTSCWYKPTKRTMYTHKLNTAANKQTSFPGKHRRLVWVATEKMHIFTSTSVFPWWTGGIKGCCRAWAQTPLIDCTVKSYFQLCGSPQFSFKGHAGVFRALSVGHRHAGQTGWLINLTSFGWYYQQATLGNWHKKKRKKIFFQCFFLFTWVKRVESISTFTRVLFCTSVCTFARVQNVNTLDKYTVRYLCVERPRPRLWPLTQWICKDFQSPTSG